RCERIVAILAQGPKTAYEIAAGLWRARTIAEQPLLVIYEVVGHLELLMAGGDVTEQVADGRSLFSLTPAGRAARRGPRLSVQRRQPRHTPSPSSVSQR